MSHCSGGRRCLLIAGGERLPAPEFAEAVLRNARRYGFDELMLERGGCAELFAPAKLDALSLRFEAGVALVSVDEVMATGEPFLLLPAGRLLDVNLLELAAPLDGEQGARVSLAEDGRLGAAWLHPERVRGLDVQALVKGAGCEIIQSGAPCAENSGELKKLLRRPAVFFDRDGVLNFDSGYPSRPEELVWNEGAREAVRLVNDAGCHAFVVTNQSGIGRGYFDEPTVCAFHRHMNDQLAEAFAHVDDFRLCPHAPGEGCGCRKPEPGLVLELARDWPVDMERSLLVGDKDSDMLAAAAAGIRGVRYEGGSLHGLLAPLVGEMRAARLRSLGEPGIV